MKSPTKVLGDWGEDMVAYTLQQQGFIIRARNYRTAFGEIDIIAQQKEVVAFVEVKTRKNSYFDISQVITLTKQKKMVKVAKAFIAQHVLDDIICRFDVAIVEGHAFRPSLTYIPDAFYEHE